MEVRVKWLDCIQKLFDSCVRQTQGFNVNIKWITKLFKYGLVIEIILLHVKFTESLSNY